MTPSETKVCQNCKQSFTIEPQDFDFYKKMDVPPPTFCPDCRFQRRLMFRNERALYRRTCGLCGINILSMFAPDKYPVYCQPCWWSDKWDATAYGQEYDSNRNFFEQYRELQKKVPYMALINSYTTLVNSEYVNHTGGLKNCYWIFNADFCENVLYGTMVNYVKDGMDLTMVGAGSELCYMDVDCGKSFRIFFSEDCFSSHDIYFSKNLTGCDHCIGCINLRNKSYHVFNKPVSKEEFEKALQESRLDSHQSVADFEQRVRKFWLEHPHKYYHGFHNTNASGDYFYFSKNAHFMYESECVEDGKFCQWITLKPVKDAYDYTEWGNGAQRIYDCITVGENADNMKFCYGSWSNISNVEYGMFVISSPHTFGCVNVRKKQYCILNKQYTKEEYEELRAKIIEDMNTHPYIDSKGRIWKYGEFFPYDLSLFDYNETTAIQYYPLAKEEILERGWRWREPVQNEYRISKKAADLPDSIYDVSDDIVKEVIECQVCVKAFRIIPSELALLKRFGFPLPRKCPYCRHVGRMARLNPPRLWDRACAKCGKDIKTSYALDRPEIVYCEQCYQSEVA
jgi:Zn ribbon nucleic-acid-binding protein